MNGTTKLSFFRAFGAFIIDAGDSRGVFGDETRLSDVIVFTGLVSAALGSVELFFLIAFEGKVDEASRAIGTECGDRAVLAWRREEDSESLGTAFQLFFFVIVDGKIEVFEPDMSMMDGCSQRTARTQACMNNDQ